MTAKTATKSTVDYMKFYVEPYPGQNDDEVVTWETTCQRCGGMGGAEAWKMTGYNCYLCGGNGNRKQHTSTVGKERTKAKNRARYAAKKEQQRLAELAVRDARTIGLAETKPVLANFSFAGLDVLDAHLSGWARNTLADLIVSADTRELSEKQIALAEKLLTEAIEKRDAPADETVAGVAPAGEKVAITVDVVKIKMTENAYGSVIKMMGNAVDENGNEYRVFMTAPKKMLDTVDADFDYYAAPFDRWFNEHPLVGKSFSFVAGEAKRADDDSSMCFVSRPSKLKML